MIAKSSLLVCVRQRRNTNPQHLCKVSGCLRSVLRSLLCNLTNRGPRIPEPLLMFTSTCPLKVHISKGLGPIFQIARLKAGRISILRIGRRPRAPGGLVRPRRREEDRLPLGSHLAATSGIVDVQVCRCCCFADDTVGCAKGVLRIRVGLHVCYGCVASCLRLVWMLTFTAKHRRTFAKATRYPQSYISS